MHLVHTSCSLSWLHRYDRHRLDAFPECHSSIQHDTTSQLYHVFLGLQAYNRYSFYPFHIPLPCVCMLHPIIRLLALHVSKQSQSIMSNNFWDFGDTVLMPIQLKQFHICFPITSFTTYLPLPNRSVTDRYLSHTYKLYNWQLYQMDVRCKAEWQESKYGTVEPA